MTSILTPNTFGSQRLGWLDSRQIDSSVEDMEELCSRAVGHHY